MWSEERRAFCRYFPLLLTLLLLPTARADEVISVNDSRSILTALEDPTVTLILLRANITWDANEAVTLEAGRHVTIKGLEGSFNATDEHSLDTSRALFLSFNDRAFAITIPSKASLTFEDLVLTGLKSTVAMPAAGQGTPRAKAFELWPTINPLPGAEVGLNNTLYQYIGGSCDEQEMKKYVQGHWSMSGASRAGIKPDGVTCYLLGPQFLMLPMECYGAQECPGSQGNMQLANYGSASTCIPGQSSTSETGGGTGTAWWVWLLVGIGASLALASGVLAAAWWMRRCRKATQSSAEVQDQHQAGDRKTARASAKVDPFSRPPATYPPSGVFSASRQGSAESQLSGVAHALRIRFGNLDQIELGELIGKGGYGRVYRARWRGAQVAVKVIDHSAQRWVRDDDTSSSSPLADPSWESVLSTALSHPNLVATYRVGTVQLQPASRGPSKALSSHSTNIASGAEASSEVGTSTSQRALVSASAAAAAAVGESSSGAEVTGTSSSSPGLPGTALGLQEARRTAKKHADAGVPHPGEQISSPQLAAPAAAAAAVPSSLGATSQSQTSEAGHLEEQFYETWMVLEYCDKGSLADAIRARKFLSRGTGQPNLKAVLMCLQDVARGMVYLHALSILHGDLKPDNVLMKSREDGARGLQCKIADFGLSRLLEAGTGPLVTRTCGTISYMPPELMAHGRLTQAADVYSFGLLMYELLSCKFAFSTETAAQIFYRVVHLGERPAIPEGLECPPEYAALMQQCWAEEPTERPDFIYILKELEAMVARYATEPKSQTQLSPTGFI